MLRSPRADEGEVNIILKVYKVIISTLQTQQKCLYLYEEDTLQKPFLDVFRVPVLTFIQTSDVEVITGIVIVNTVPNFRPNADKRDVSLR